MKKKQFILIVSIFALIFASLVALVIIRQNNSNKDEISEELRAAREMFDIRLSKDGKEYIIYGLKSSYNVEGSNIIIPDSVDKIPVTSLIDKNLRNFSCFNKVSSIKLGKNVSYIGIVNTNVNDTFIHGENIFSGALKLVSITVDEDNQTFSSEDGVLYNKDKTMLIKYPAFKTSVGTANHSFTIPETVKYIYQKAFYQNKSIDTIILGSNVEIIYNEAFSGCTSLVKVEFNKKLQKISTRAFEGCTKLDGVVINEGVTEIRFHAFYDCIKMSSIYIPSTLVEMDYNVFIGCTNLTKIYTPNENVENLKTILTNTKHTELLKLVSGK